MYVNRSKCNRKACFSQKSGTFHHVPNTNSGHCEFTLSLRCGYMKSLLHLLIKNVCRILKGTKNALTY